MIPRYEGEHAKQIFSDKNKFHLWSRLTIDAMVRIAPDNMQLAIESFDWTPTPEAVRTREGTYQHDVVAFLSLMADKMPEPWHPYLHYGMTSSDLVENAHFRMLHEHTIQLLIKWSNLHNAVGLTVPRDENDEVKAVCRPGRTHGQLAEPTSWNNQIGAWGVSSYNLAMDLTSLSTDMLVSKTVGPVGCGLMRHDSPKNPVPSTQVVPRDYQLMWATVYLRLACHLENLAMLVRNGSRSEVGEIREGRTSTQVGSSAMPHKRNPIQSEKVCGLARLARGYFMSIAETTGALWDDRDLSNSSVERVAVADLAHTVEHMVDTMTHVITNLELDTGRMIQNAKNPECWTSVIQALLQKHAKLSPIAAGQVVRELLGDGDPEWLIVRTYEWFNRNNKAYAGSEFLQDYAATWDAIFEPETPTNPDFLLAPF